MTSLSVKYRPKTFDEIVGQDSIVKVLTRQIESNNIRNTYLFCGTSGSGKTTSARAFANAINSYQGSPIEIDAASNNGVDNIKQIVKSASERSLDSVYKVYIIDECHVLSNQAWQAFLKCIEEPPKYTIFIFCTTEKNKVPDTIKNRCQVFTFNRIDSSIIKNRLAYISSKEGYINYDATCDYISRISEGQMRLAISLLEKCSDFNVDLDISNTLPILGNFSYDEFFKLINSIIDRDEFKSLSIIARLYSSGSDMINFIDQFFVFCLDISKYLITQDITATKIPLLFEANVKSSINFDNVNKYYNYYVNKLIQLKNAIKQESNIKEIIDAYIMMMCRCE